MCQNNQRPYLAAIDHEAKVVYWLRPDCKLWSCWECAEVNKRRWTAIIFYGMAYYEAKEGEKQWHFITITANRWRRGLLRSKKDFQERWPRSYSRMKRKWPGIHYVMLPEAHRDGTLHMHAIFSEPVTKRWLKDNAAEVGLGYMADGQAIRSRFAVGGYVIKYITKSLKMGNKWPRSLHRVRTSHKWPKIPEEHEKTLELAFKAFSSSKFDEKRWDWNEQGFSVVNVATGEMI